MRPFLFHCETIGLAIAGTFVVPLSPAAAGGGSEDDYEDFSSIPKLICAILYTLYHMVESTQTNRHGEYPVLYTMWAIALINDQDYMHACIWGIAINFVLLSGYAKIASGGSSLLQWTDSSTLETYLTCYRLARNKIDRPLLPKLNKIISHSKTLTSCLAGAVLLLEVIVVPASLFMPSSSSSRSMVCNALIAMHIGIASIMSVKVGLAFLTTIPVYQFAFTCNVEIGSHPWFVAVLVGSGPTVFTWLIMPIPENWPFTPVSLFMWDGTTAQVLLRLFMTEDTRMVLSTTKVASKGIIGLQVLHHGAVVESKERSISKVNYGNDDDDDGLKRERCSYDDDGHYDNNNVVHDCVMKTIGFTLIQGGEPMLEAIAALKHNPKITGPAVQTFVHRTWASLTLDRRFIEAHTGDDLSHVFLVRIDDNNRVSSIIM